MLAEFPSLYDVAWQKDCSAPKLNYVTTRHIRICISDLQRAISTGYSGWTSRCFWIILTWQDTSVSPEVVALCPETAQQPQIRTSDHRQQTDDTNRASLRFIPALWNCLGIAYGYIDIISVNETHVDSNSETQPYLQGFERYWRCRNFQHIRAKKCSGGVGIFVNGMLLKHYRVSDFDGSFTGILGLLFRREKLVAFNLSSSRVICLRRIYHGEDVILEHISETFSVKYISIIMSIVFS